MLYVFGGLDTIDGKGNKDVVIAHKYDSAKDAWSSAPEMDRQRYHEDRHVSVGPPPPVPSLCRTCECRVAACTFPSDAVVRPDVDLALFFSILSLPPGTVDAAPTTKQTASSGLLAADSAAKTRTPTRAYSLTYATHLFMHELALKRFSFRREGV